MGGSQPPHPSWLSLLLRPLWSVGSLRLRLQVCNLHPGRGQPGDRPGLGLVPGGSLPLPCPHPWWYWWKTGIWFRIFVHFRIIFYVSNILGSTDGLLQSPGRAVWSRPRLLVHDLHHGSHLLHVWEEWGWTQCASLSDVLPVLECLLLFPDFPLGEIQHRDPLPALGLRLLHGDLLRDVPGHLGVRDLSFCSKQFHTKKTTTDSYQ